MTKNTDALSHITNLLRDLEEAHQYEITTNHAGDTAAGCSYCQSIKDAKRYLAAARKSPPRVVIKVEGGVAELADFTDGVQAICIDYDVEGCDNEALCYCHIAGADGAHVHRKLHEETYFAKTSVKAGLNGGRR